MSNGHGGTYSSINRVPRGLLGVLDLVSQGEAPHFLPNTVQPAIELRPFYEFNQREVASVQAVGTIAAAGAWYSTAGLTNGTPADGELWHVTAMGVRSTAVLAAGTTVSLALAYRIGPLGNVIIGPMQTFTAGQWIGCGIACDLWFGPGDVWGLWCDQYVAGTAPTPVHIAQIHRYRG